MDYTHVHTHRHTHPLKKIWKNTYKTINNACEQGRKGRGDRVGENVRS